MNKPFGQLLLWTGFISAALATCAQKEYDFLPEVEQTALKELQSGGAISQSELDQRIVKSVDQLSTEEFETLISSITPIINERADFSKLFKSLKT